MLKTRTARISVERAKTPVATARAISSLVIPLYSHLLSIIIEVVVGIKVGFVEEVGDVDTVVVVCTAFVVCGG